MEYTATTFNLGTSTVLTLPKGLGIQIGTKVKIKKVKSGITIQFESGLEKEKKIQRDLALLEKLAGSNKNKFNLSPKEMNKLYDEGIYGQISR